jgi:cadmium resistance protein CadD (predicted permease)
MGNLLLILGVLFIGIILMVNAARWFGPDANNPTINKLRRWIVPLLALGFIIQLISYYWIK